MTGAAVALLAELAVASEEAARSEPRELAVIRWGHVKTGAGTYGQWFSTYHDIHHDLRWFVERVFPVLINSTRSGMFSLAELRSLVQALIGRRMDFVSWLGLETFARHTDGLLSLLSELETAEELEQCLVALNLYASRVFFWTTHYYPWGAVGLFPLRSEEDLRQGLEILEGSRPAARTRI